MNGFTVPFICDSILIVLRTLCDSTTRRSILMICLYLLYWLFQVMVRLQTAMGAEGVRWSSHVTRAVRSHMAAWHSPLQQVSSSTASWILIIMDTHWSGIYRSGTACCQEWMRERKCEREREGEIETERHWGSSEHTFNTRWFCVLTRNANYDQYRNIEHVFISFVAHGMTIRDANSPVISITFHAARYFIWNESE